MYPVSGPAVLRAYCPALNSRVAGAADFRVGLETTVSETLPSAYVLPVDEAAGPNETMNALFQEIDERIAVVVEFDSTADRRGQGGVSQVESMKYALFAAILNWNPDSTRYVRGLQYDGGRLLEFDRSRLFYEYRFIGQSTISEDDGFQPDGTLLNGIDGTITNSPTGTYNIYIQTIENVPAAATASMLPLVAKGTAT